MPKAAYFQVANAQAALVATAAVFAEGEQRHIDRGMQTLQRSPWQGGLPTSCRPRSERTVGEALAVPQLLPELYGLRVIGP